MNVNHAGGINRIRLEILSIFKVKMAGFSVVWGKLPIIPGDDKFKEAAFEALHDILEDGGVTGIFSEGNRSRDGKLQRGWVGITTLAHQSQVPVVPIGIIGNYEIFPRGKK